MPSAAPRKDRTSSTARAVPAADAVVITASPMTVVVPTAAAPRSRLRREVARRAYSSQRSFWGCVRMVPRLVMSSPAEEVGGVEDDAQHMRDPVHHDRMGAGDLGVHRVAHGLAAGLDQQPASVPARHLLAQVV